MEKRQHAEHAIIALKREDLAHLLDVRADVVMREHDALGFAGAATGKNHGGEIVQRIFCFVGDDVQESHYFFRAEKLETPYVVSYNYRARVPTSPPAKATP